MAVLWDVLSAVCLVVMKAVSGAVLSCRLNWAGRRDVYNWAEKMNVCLVGVGRSVVVLMAVNWAFSMAGPWIV